MKHIISTECAELGLGVPGAWNILYFHEQIQHQGFRGNQEILTPPFEFNQLRVICNIG